MDALAAEAFLNAEHEVFGLKMLPLSLGHAFTLEAVASPFFEGRGGTEEQLRLAAWICSRPPLSLPNTESKECRVWLKKPFIFEEQALRWKTYVSDYCAPPQMWNKQLKAGETRGEPSAIPSGIVTVVKLMKLGMSERQAWATPIGAAAWYEAALFEQEVARLDIVTDAERMAIMRSKERQKEQEQANVG